MRLIAVSLLSSLCWISSGYPTQSIEILTLDQIVPKVNLSPSQFASDYEIFTAYQFTLQSLSTYLINNEMRHAAIFARPISPNDGSATPSEGQILFQNLTVAEYENKVSLLVNSGHKVSLIDVYTTDDGSERYTAVLSNSGSGVKNVALPNLTGNWVQDATAKYLSGGKYEVSSLSCSSQSCSAVLELSTAASKSRNVILHNLTQEEFDGKLKQHAKSKMFPSVVSVYRVGKELRFTAVVQNSSGESRERHLMSEDEFGSINDENVGKGLKAWRLTGTEDKGVAKFSAIWR